MPKLQQYDPLNTPASSDEIRAAWLEIMELPVTAGDGKVFQYDLVSERLMKSAVDGWDVAGITTLNWRLNDNTTVTVDKTQLQSYIDQLEIARTLRGFVLDAEYVAFKSNGATKRELANWRKSYDVSGA